MSKSFRLLLSLLLPAGAALAQAPVLGPSLNTQPGEGTMTNINKFTTLAGRNGVPINGSPYADSRWLLARLVTTSNVTLPQLPLKYDVLNQQLLMRPTEHPTDSLKLDDSSLMSFELEEPGADGTAVHKRLFRRFAESDVPAQRMEYVEVLHEGKYTLLKRYLKTFRQAAANNGFNVSTRNEITATTNYYLTLPGAGVVGGAKRVKLMLKDLQNAAPQLAAAIAAAPSADKATTEAEWVAVLAAADPR